MYGRHDGVDLLPDCRIKRNTLDGVGHVGELVVHDRDYLVQKPVGAAQQLSKVISGGGGELENL